MASQPELKVQGVQEGLVDLVLMIPTKQTEVLEGVPVMSHRIQMNLGMVGQVVLEVGVAKGAMVALMEQMDQMAKVTQAKVV